jgi:hypothetical protein
LADTSLREIPAEWNGISFSPQCWGANPSASSPNGICAVCFVHLLCPSAAGAAGFPAGCGSAAQAKIYRADKSRVTEPEMVPFCAKAGKGD